nr:MAG TPA: hypothetical protein [Caudoviricetes sp.]
MTAWLVCVGVVRFFFGFCSSGIGGPPFISFHADCTTPAPGPSILKILCIEPGIAGGVDHVVENVFWISGFLHQDLDEIADTIVFTAGELPNEIDTVHDGHSVRIIVQIHNETGTRVEVVNGHCGQSGGFCGLRLGLSDKRGILGPDGLQLGGQAGILGTERVKLHVGISCADRGACSARDEGESGEDGNDDLFHGKNSFCPRNLRGGSGVV